jgi:hypothetical protein
MGVGLPLTALFAGPFEVGSVCEFFCDEAPVLEAMFADDFDEFEIFLNWLRVTIYCQPFLAVFYI